MTSPDRIDELEVRILDLEQRVLELQRDSAPSAMLMRAFRGIEQVVWPRRVSGGRIPADADPPLPSELAVAETAIDQGVGPRIVLEQWLGQRAFLAIGVVAALAAAGYFMVLAFERGWISPAVRCAGGAVVGLATAASGWRLFQRGLQRYGAALIGTGVGIVYLSAWAATKLYGFIPTMGGAVSLAALSVLLTLIALLLDVEALSAAAVVGGLLAPVFLGVGQGVGSLFLVYLGALIVAMGWAAVSRRWRFTARLLVAFSFLLMPMAAEGGASAIALAMYGGAIGFTTILAGTKAGWGEIRALGFLSGWAALWASTEARPPAPWVSLGAALLLSWPSWRAGLRRQAAPSGATPTLLGIDETLPQYQPVPAETRYFYLTAVLLSAVAARTSPDGMTGIGTALLMVGIGYVMPGLAMRIAAFEVVAAIALMISGLLLSPSIATGCWILLLQAVAWAGSDHALRRAEGRWMALVPLTAALYWLVGSLMAVPPEGDPAFIGTVALVTWSLVVVAAALAAGLWRRVEGDESPARSLPRALWAVAGSLVLVGVTREISWYFRHATLPDRTRVLAGGLMVSAWWAVFAGLLVALGFRLRSRPVRVAGLLVAGVAAAKVVLVDLQMLEALYRVASVFTLALVFLGVSYLYNRRARAMLSQGPAATD